MLIRMKERRQGSPDGRHVYLYDAGGIYSADTEPPVDDDLASVFVREGWADDLDAPSPAETPAAKRATKVTKPDEVKEADGEEQQ